MGGRGALSATCGYSDDEPVPSARKGIDMAGLTGWHLLIILAAFVLLFGAKRLPDMARAVGQSARIFKGEMRGAAAEEERARGSRYAPEPAHAIEQHPPAQVNPQPVSPAHQSTPDATRPPTL